MNAYKFSSTATEQAPDILKGQTPEQFLKTNYTKGCIFGLDNLKTSGVYKLSGWAFDFRPYLKLFAFIQYGQIYKAYAPNRTALRKSEYGKIDRIAEF